MLILAEPTPTLTERLAAELATLLELTSIGLLVWFVLLVVIVWALGVLVPLGIHVAWRLGLDGERRLTFAASLARISALLVAIVGALQPFFVRAPTLTIAGALLIAALLSAIAPTSLRNLAAGLGLALRGRLRPGDLVRIGDVEGTIRDVGLARVRLRTAEGGVTLVPAADFDRLPLTIGSRQAAVPVEVSFQPGVAIDDAMLEQLRRVLWLSPFRRAGTDVRLRHDPESGRLDAAIDTWTERSSPELERHLRDLLRRATNPVATAVAAEDEDAP